MFPIVYAFPYWFPLYMSEITVCFPIGSGNAFSIITAIPEKCTHLHVLDRSRRSGEVVFACNLIVLVGQEKVFLHVTWSFSSVRRSCLGVRNTECAQTNHMSLWDQDHMEALDIPQRIYAFYFENFQIPGNTCTNIKNFLCS